MNYPVTWTWITLLPCYLNMNYPVTCYPGKFGYLKSQICSFEDGHPKSVKWPISTCTYRILCNKSISTFCGCDFGRPSWKWKFKVKDPRTHLGNSHIHKQWGRFSLESHVTQLLYMICFLKCNNETEITVHGQNVPCVFLIDFNLDTSQSDIQL